MFAHVLFYFVYCATFAPDYEESLWGLCDYLHPSFERLSFGQPTEIELQSEDLVEAFQDNGGFNMYLSKKPC